MADTQASDEYLVKQGLSVEQIDVLCRIEDNRSVATDSFDKFARRLLKTLYAYITSETYANGEHWLLNDKGYEVVREYNRLAEADYAAITAEREAMAKTRGYRLFGHALGIKEDIPVELHEATICSTPKGLRDLAAHLLEVAAEMEKTSQENMDSGMHWHFQPESRPEIVICGLDTGSKALPAIVYDEALEGYKRP